MRGQVIFLAVMRGRNPVSVGGLLVHFSGYSVGVAWHSFSLDQLTLYFAPERLAGIVPLPQPGGPAIGRASSRSGTRHLRHADQTGAIYCRVKRSGRGALVNDAPIFPSNFPGAQGFERIEILLKLRAERSLSPAGIPTRIASAHAASDSRGATYSLFHSRAILLPFRFAFDSRFTGCSGNRRRRIFARPCTAPTAAASASRSVDPHRE